MGTYCQTFASVLPSIAQNQEQSSPKLKMSDEAKPSSDLLQSIQDGATLKSVNAPAENLAGKKDMALHGISNFDKNKLKQTETVEKNVLPSAEDLKEADTE